jgi:hypothetical protein
MPGEFLHARKVGQIPWDGPQAKDIIPIRQAAAKNAVPNNLKDGVQV